MEGEGVINYTITLTVIKKTINKIINVEDWRNRKFLFENLSNIFLHEHFQVTVAKPLRQFYHPLILGT